MKWSDHDPHDNIAPATGPDTRQPDLVCRQKVIDLLEQKHQEAQGKLAEYRGAKFYVSPNCVQLKVSDLCEELIEMVRKL